MKSSFWAKITACLVAQLFLFSSISPLFASPDTFRSHLREAPTRAADGGVHLLSDLRSLQGVPFKEAIALADRVGETRNLDERIVRLKAILRDRGTLASPPEKWIPILVYALAPKGPRLRLFTAVEKSQKEIFQQCESCGVRLLHQAPVTDAESPSLSLDLVGAFATAIDAVSHGGLIQTHPITHEVMHSAYALSLLMDGSVIRLQPGESELDRLAPFLRKGEFLMAHVGEKDPHGDHFVQIKEIGRKTVTLLDRGEEKTVARGDFLNAWTGVVISKGRVLEQFALEERYAQKAFGCCGISAASGVSLYTVADAKHEVPIARSFLAKLASVGKRVINILQSRGFDNYADGRKYFMHITGDWEKLSSETRYVILKDDRMLVVEVKGDRDKNNRIIKFMVSSRGVGSSVANSDIITADIEHQILEVARKVFPGKDIFIANDIRTSDYHLYDRNEVPSPPPDAKIYSLEEALHEARSGLTRAISFSAESREEIEEAFSKMGREYQDYSIVKSEKSGKWELYSNKVAFRRIYLEGVDKHTRYKTKGTDRKVNAHHWIYKGYTLGHNGDFESFNVFRALLEKYFKESFEGQTDSEVLLHIIGDLGEEKTDAGAIYQPSEVAIRRAFRLIERVESLLSLRKILSDKDFEGLVQDHIRGELEQLGFSPGRVAEILEASSYGEKGEISKVVEELIIEAIQDPKILDGVYVNYYKLFTKFLAQLGAQKPWLKPSADKAKKVIERGISNIAINALSLHDIHQVVVARMYEDNNKFFLLLSRDGDLVVMASEARGAAPEVGVMTAVPRSAIPGVLSIARGRIKQIESPPWSILTVDATQIRHHDVISGTSTDGRDLVKETEIKWNVIENETAYAEDTDFERETKLQPVTVNWTFEAFTAHSGGEYRLETDELNLQKKDFETAPTVVGIGSGSSLNALRQVQAEMGYFDIVESSNDIQYDFPRSITPGSIFVVVSQSGETGAALSAARLALEKGAKVVVITNRRGSSLYNIGKESGGVMVTESVDEQAVAATGSNSSQVQALRLFGLRRDELLERGQPGDRLAELSRLGAETIPAILRSFEPNGEKASDGGGKNLRVVTEKIFPYLERHGIQGGFVGNQIIITGMGPVQKGAGDEIGLKITEVSRHPVMSVDMETLLAYGLSEEGTPSSWDGNKVDELLGHNLRAYTTGEPNEIGDQPEFGRRQNFHLTDATIEHAPQIVLLNNGRYDALMAYLYAKYRGDASIPVALKKYSARKTEIPKGAIVIAFEPQTAEEKSFLAKLQANGIKPIVITTRAGAAQMEEVPSGGALVVRTDGLDTEFQFGVVGELLMAYLLKIRGDADSAFANKVVEEYKKVDISSVVSSFREKDSLFHNKENLDRLIQIARNRRWQFNIWSTGKTSLLGAAIDLSLRTFADLKRLAGWGETSEFKHGPYSATNFGDFFVTQYPGEHASEYQDVIKTAIDEVIPRINYPYSLLSKELEPGTVVFIGKADPNDRYMQHLSDAEFEALRALRKRGEFDKGLQPDIVFSLPTGHFLERIALNYLVTQALAKAKAEDLKEDDRGNIFFVVEGTDKDSEAFSHFQPRKMELRKRFPNALFISIAPRSNATAKATSDAVLETETEDFTEALVIGHHLASLFVRRRFEATVGYLLNLYKQVESHPAFGGSSYNTPGELLIGYGFEEPEAIAVLGKILGEGKLPEFKQRIIATFENVNMDFFKAFNSARLENELWHSLIDLIEKLAKVVTNRDGGEKSIDPVERRIGQFVKAEPPAAVSDSGTKDIAFLLTDTSHDIAAALKKDSDIGEEGFSARIDTVNPKELFEGIDARGRASDYEVRTLAQAIGRQILLERSQRASPEAAPMPFSEDPYVSEIASGASQLQGLKLLVLPAARLLDPQMTQEALLDLLKRSGSTLLFLPPVKGEDRERLERRFGSVYRGVEERFFEKNRALLSQASFVVWMLDEDYIPKFHGEFLSLLPFEGEKKFFYVPAKSHVDLAKEMLLGIHLLEQSSSLGDLTSLNLMTQLLLVEITQGFGRAGKLVTVAEVQGKVVEAKRLVTQVLKGL